MYLWGQQMMVEYNTAVLYALDEFPIVKHPRYKPSILMHTHGYEATANPQFPAFDRACSISSRSSDFIRNDIGDTSCSKGKPQKHDPAVSRCPRPRRCCPRSRLKGMGGGSSFQGSHSQHRSFFKRWLLHVPVQYSSSRACAMMFAMPDNAISLSLA